ncbi:hypothetical protein [Streptomyces sp. NBC_00996]|uniref:hypothetical protein n=1 Tax=Streptomyces sp. NBC_00996 TaxID=2903710 RepID=UPI00386C7DFB|nr:hypothetical protein OG390_28660 [Streptomyces sp. NBC_00996]
MTEEHDLARPRATPAPRRHKPSFATAKGSVAVHPLDQLAPDLDQPWLKEDTDTPDRTTLYTHPEGHRIGLRLQPDDMTIQTWITAGPDLPPIPAGTAEEKAAAQAANDARLRPGRSWHATVTTRHPRYVRGLLGTVIRDQLIPALINKPKRVPTALVRKPPTAEAAPEAKTAPAKKHRATTKKKETPK